MKSLERRFRNITEKNPSLSSYACFAKTVKEQRFNKQTIHRWFQKLVNKDDYVRKEKRAILRHLEKLSNLVRTTKIRGETVL
jgi:hypothetical protein